MISKKYFKTLIYVSLTFFIILSLGMQKSSAQLRIYQGSQQTSTYGDCVAQTIYAGTTIPGGLDNQIVSIQLSKGYMATLAENEDGSGNGYPFMAVTSDLLIDLNTDLKNKVSFIRVLPISNTLKKGACYKSPATDPNNNTVVDQLNVTWLYDWGASDVSTSTREYTLMAWGSAAANQTNVNNYIAKTGINHLLSFNEPDNSGQSNILYTNAIPLYKNLLATGYRLGSPATQEQNAQTGRWLGNFMALAQTNNERVDYVDIHWYDWGSYSSTNNTTPDVNGVFTRFKNYVNNIYNTYKKPIWITEFNANPNTTAQTHVNFMALALPWLESQNFIERYAYFFPTALPPVDVSGALTAMGTAYKSPTSTLAIRANMDDTPDTLSLEAEDATLTGGATITSCTSGSGGKIVPAFTGSQWVTFNTFAATSTNYKLRIYYYSKNTATNATLKINGNNANIISLPSTTGWCYEGKSAGYYDVNVALSGGNNTLVFSESPILDRIQIIKIPATTLPITLTNFNAEVKDYGIKINWKTAQELNNQYFEISKADEQKQFKVLSQVKGAINSTSPKFYSFTDFNPSNGTNYYQLKQVDLDGKSEIFNPIAVKFGLADDSFKLLSVSASDINVNISVSEAREGVVTYTDIDGKISFQKSIKLINGINTVTIPMAQNSTVKIGIITYTSGKEQKSLKIIR